MRCNCCHWHVHIGKGGIDDIITSIINFSISVVIQRKLIQTRRGGDDAIIIVVVNYRRGDSFGFLFITHILVVFGHDPFYGLHALVISVHGAMLFALCYYSTPKKASVISLSL